MYFGSTSRIYFYDNGIRNALARDFRPLPLRQDAGTLWESLFFTELLKKHAFVRDGGEIYFWRSRQKHEVAFLEIVDGEVKAFECKLSPTRPTPSMKAFERMYPDCPVAVATPLNIDELQ